MEAAWLFCEYERIRSKEWHFEQGTNPSRGEYLLHALDGLSGFIRICQQAGIDCFVRPIGIKEGNAGSNSTGIWVIHFPANWTFEGVAEELDQHISKIFDLRQLVRHDLRRVGIGPVPQWIVDLTVAPY